MAVRIEQPHAAQQSIFTWTLGIKVRQTSEIFLNSWSVPFIYVDTQNHRCLTSVEPMTIGILQGHSERIAIRCLWYVWVEAKRKRSKLMDSGRIQAIIIATSAGNVVYERFYEKFGEQEKAELRATVAESAEESLKTNPQGTDFTSRWRSPSSPSPLWLLPALPIVRWT